MTLRSLLQQREEQFEAEKHKLRQMLIGEKKKFKKDLELAKKTREDYEKRKLVINSELEHLKGHLREFEDELAAVRMENSEMRSTLERRGESALSRNEQHSMSQMQLFEKPSSSKPSGRGSRSTLDDTRTSVPRHTSNLNSSSNHSPLKKCTTESHLKFSFNMLKTPQSTNSKSGEKKSLFGSKRMSRRFSQMRSSSKSFATTAKTKTAQITPRNEKEDIVIYTPSAEPKNPDSFVEAEEEQKLAKHQSSSFSRKMSTALSISKSLEHVFSRKPSGESKYLTESSFDIREVKIPKNAQSSMVSARAENDSSPVEKQKISEKQKRDLTDRLQTMHHILKEVMSQNEEQRKERETMQKQMVQMFEELRDAKLAWSVSDENKTNKQNTASMFEMRSIEGGEGCLSSLSRMDRMQSPLKTYEEDEEFSESMNEHNSPGLNVFPKTKSKKSPPDFRPPKNKIQNCFSLTKLRRDGNSGLRIDKSADEVHDSSTSGGEKKSLVKTLKKDKKYGAGIKNLSTIEYSSLKKS